MIPAETVHRDRLWYDIYEYSGRYYLPECFVMRTMDHDHIDRVIKMRRNWAGNSAVYPGSWAARWRKFALDQTQVQHLHDVCDFFINDKREKKLVFSTDHFTVYTNDEVLLKDIRDLSALQNKAVWFSQVVVTGDPNVISLRKSKHTMRSYFRNLSLSGSVMTSIKSFLQAQEDITPSRSLQRAMEVDHARRFFDHYFFDHDSMAPVNMLCMIHPGCIRKTMPIIADK
jgi:hypothetical protein